MSLAVSAYFTALVIQLDSAPTALAHIGWRLILIYLCCLAICIPILFVFCPETKGKSLEEIGVIFGDRHLHISLTSAETLQGTVHSSDKHNFPHAEDAHEHVEG
ncbi:hypothetical protein LTR13_009559 [Exophiala sideris]|nr:hypothetical protein LTR13_009559 [Exophiala sideris]